jgi:hypothetical protein
MKPFTHKSCAGANMVYSRAERQHSSAALRETFSNAYPDKEVLNKTTIHRLVTKFRDAGSVCLWQELIGRQNSWDQGCTDFKQCISCNNGIRLPEFNIAIRLVVLRKWREQRPSNQGDLDSSVTGEAGRIYYTGVDLLLISSLYRIMWLVWGCVLNGVPCTMQLTR